MSWHKKLQVYFQFRERKAIYSFLKKLSSVSPDVVASVVLFSVVVCTVLVLLGVVVYTVEEVVSTVLVGTPVVDDEIVVTFVLSTVVVASVELDSGTAAGEKYIQIVRKLWHFLYNNPSKSHINQLSG